MLPIYTLTSLWFNWMFYNLCKSLFFYLKVFDLFHPFILVRRHMTRSTKFQLYSEAFHNKPWFTVAFNEIIYRFWNIVFQSLLENSIFAYKLGQNDNFHKYRTVKQNESYTTNSLHFIFPPFSNEGR